jgi:hypothetical protein
MIRTTLLSFFLTCFHAVPVTAIGDDLIGALEAEAEHGEVDQANIAGSTSSISQFRSDRYEQFMQQRRFIPADLTKQELKLFFFNEFFETYSNYIDLDKPQQQQVYEYYRQLPSADIAQIDDKILELLSR